MITITGTVGAESYLVTGMPVDAPEQYILKLSFENNTGGTNLALLAGTIAEFNSGTGGLQLSDSGGPGFVFLTIVDAHSLSGKVIFVRREVGSADSKFTLTID